MRHLKKLRNVISPVALCAVPPPDVPAWLKSLRLHKYASLFSQMTYEEMMILTEKHLESQVSSAHINTWSAPSPAHLTFTMCRDHPDDFWRFWCNINHEEVNQLMTFDLRCAASSDPLCVFQNVTKGARHKIALSIQKLRERQSVLKSLEKVSDWARIWISFLCVLVVLIVECVVDFQDILEGGNVRNALQELQQIIITPIKVYAPPTAAQKEVEPGVTPVDKAANPGEEKEPEGFQTHNPPACDGESSSTPISDGDIAGQFTRVMGKGTHTHTQIHTCEISMCSGSLRSFFTFLLL